jgi:hypothetical protein
MNPTTLQKLTERVTDGDRAAMSALRAEMEPHLERILRRALRPNTPRSPMTDGLRHVACRVLRADSPVGTKPCAPRLAAHLTNRVIDRLRHVPAACGSAETLVDSLYAS